MIIGSQGWIGLQRLSLWLRHELQYFNWIVLDHPLLPFLNFNHTLRRLCRCVISCYAVRLACAHVRVCEGWHHTRLAQRVDTILLDGEVISGKWGAQRLPLEQLFELFWLWGPIARDGWAAYCLFVGLWSVTGRYRHDAHISQCFEFFVFWFGFWLRLGLLSPTESVRSVHRRLHKWDIRRILAPLLHCWRPVDKLHGWINDPAPRRLWLGFEIDLGIIIDRMDIAEPVAKLRLASATPSSLWWFFLHAKEF